MYITNYFFQKSLLVHSLSLSGYLKEYYYKCFSLTLNTVTFVFSRKLTTGQHTQCLSMNKSLRITHHKVSKNPFGSQKKPSSLSTNQLESQKFHPMLIIPILILILLSLPTFSLPLLSLRMIMDNFITKNCLSQTLIFTFLPPLFFPMLFYLSAYLSLSHFVSFPLYTDRFQTQVSSCITDNTHHLTASCGRGSNLKPVAQSICNLHLI